MIDIVLLILIIILLIYVYRILNYKRLAIVLFRYGYIYFKKDQNEQSIMYVHFTNLPEGPYRIFINNQLIYKFDITTENIYNISKKICLNFDDLIGSNISLYNSENTKINKISVIGEMKLNKGLF